MPKTVVPCPNCRQQVPAEINQLFDIFQDPTAKQRFLSGAFNLLQCPFCGYQGSLATPLVYHDPDKELLLTFIPPEIGLSRDEQERAIGGLINLVMSKLPQEKRKAYLLRPQSVLTLQGMVERVLEADGVTKEMIQAQQKRLSLLQRLANASDDGVFSEIVKQEDALIDADFFALLRRLGEAAVMGGDQVSGQQLAGVQKNLLAQSTYGRKMQAQAKEIESALNDLRAAGKELTREKLLELVINSPSETRLSALVSFARPLMDYSFFQMLSERIDNTRREGRTKLVDIRTRLLELTQEVDSQIEAHVREIQKLIQSMLQAKDVKAEVMRYASVIDDYFVSEVNALLTEARKQGNLEKSSKLGQILAVVEEASTPPPEVALLEEYLELKDDSKRMEFLDKHNEKVTPEFMDLLTNLMAQVESAQDKEFAGRIQAAYKQALRYSMAKSMEEP